MDGLLTLVMAGGRGERLRPLTDRRPKPVMPFAGRRLIDFTLRNCERSGLRNVVVLTQYGAETVASHLHRVWRKRFTPLEIISSQRAGCHFRGTADAVRWALRKNTTAKRVLVLAGDHVYRMDYRPLLADHDAAQADATLSVVAVSRPDACGLGVVAVDDAGVIQRFLEKPGEPPPLPDRPHLCLASMGIYVFDLTALAGYLADHEDAIDFGHDVLPGMLAAGHRVTAHDFEEQGSDSYWRDIADVDAYHGALMDHVCRDDADDDWPDGLAPEARDPWIGPGSVVVSSVLGGSVRVEHHAEIVESVLFDGVRIGAHARLRRVIVEEGVRIPAGTIVGYRTEEDERRGFKTCGSVVVVPAAHAIRTAPGA